MAVEIKTFRDWWRVSALAVDVTGQIHLAFGWTRRGTAKKLRRHLEGEGL